jgi:Protein of unknown function (DUF4238)
MNATEGTEAKTGTNDHIVPRMYLRRFAIERSGGPQVRAASIEAPEKDFNVSTRNVGAEKSFYWGSGPDGVPTHDMEAFLTGIEGEAATAFRRILDKGKLPTDNAFPDRWSPTAETRVAIAWWVAAQLIRTAPQRERLWRLHGDNPLEPPRSLRRADLHHAYIVQAVAPLAALIYARPWGFGFTSLCLLTSDTPVQVLNAREDDDPLVTAAYWDIYVPLDPHRFLYLPGQMHASQGRLMRDHRINLPGGLAIPLNHEVIETAHRHIIWHPQHDPRSRLNLDDAQAIRRSRRTHGGTGTVLHYTALDDDFGVERRWLHTHTWESDLPTGTTEDADGPKTEAELIALVQKMTAQLESAKTEFDKRQQA